VEAANPIKESWVVLTHFKLGWLNETWPRPLSIYTPGINPWYWKLGFTVPKMTEFDVEVIKFGPWVSARG
jgi:hypothetical protein